MRLFEGLRVFWSEDVDGVNQLWDKQESSTNLLLMKVSIENHEIGSWYLQHTCKNVVLLMTIVQTWWNYIKLFWDWH